jgi:Asp-tRNA(Asn)/Glu-tRNA(Gln) amidotransferase B subunit
MAKETTYAGMLGNWQRLLEPLKANAADLPHLEVPRAKLEALLTQAVGLSQEQAARTAAKQDLSQQLKSVVSEGQRLATLLRSAVKEHYGIRSEKLAEFNVQPFRGRVRKAKVAPEGSEAPVPSQSPPAPAPKAVEPTH